MRLGRARPVRQLRGIRHRARGVVLVAAPRGDIVPFMPSPDLRKRDSPLGPLRDKLVVAIATDDYELDTGFICQVATVGDLTYRTLDGSADLTETGLAVGAVISAAGIPVVLRAVRGSSTVTSIVIGIL